MPKVGDMEDGYRFLGGDPAQQENWAKEYSAPKKTESPPREPTLAQRAITSVSAKPGGYGIPRELTQFAAAAPIPLATTAIGAAIGGVPGGMIGGGAGEAINQKFGITEPSEAAVALNTAAPLVGKYIGPAIKAVAKGVTHILPGAGLPLQERAAQMASKIPGEFSPAVSSADLYEQVAKHNPYIDATPFRDQLVQMQGEVMQRLGDSPKKDSLIKFLESKINAIDQSPNGTVQFKQLRATQKEINGMISAKDSGEDLGILKQLAKGIKQSFEQSADSRFAAQGTPEAVALLKQANQTFVKEQGQKELDRVFTNTMAGTEREGGVQTFSNTARKNIKKQLNVNEDIKAAYSPAEINEMKQMLDSIGELPGLPPEHPSALYQGIRYGGPAVAGYTLGPMIGMSPGQGAVAGMTLDLALRKLVDSPVGRKLVIAAAKESGGKVSPAVAMSIAAAITGGAGGVINPAQGNIRAPGYGQSGMQPFPNEP